MNFRRTVRSSAVTATLLALMYGVVPAQDSRPARHQMRDKKPISAMETKKARTPLEAGAKAPADTLKSQKGEDVAFGDLIAESPTVLIFYRGGWCPYCTVHLQQLVAVEGDLRDLGYQILAVSPDSPDQLNETAEEKELTYQLLSDADLSLAKKFGLTFQLDPETVTKYDGYGIDLEKASGGENTANELPHPAVYLIDTEGVIQFAHWEADYKKRLSAEKIIEAAKASVKPVETE